MTDTTFPKLRRQVSLAFWFITGAFLLVTGFAMDGSTEIGHHAALILGGFAVGWGSVSAYRRR